MLVSLTSPSIACADDAASSSSPSHRSVTSSLGAAPSDESLSSSFSVALVGGESSSSSFSVALVGGKAASLAKLYSNPRLSGYVPEAFALTVDFFRPLIEQVVALEEFQRAREVITSSSPATDSGDTRNDAAEICNRIKKFVHRELVMPEEQQQVLADLSVHMESWKLAAVRSSAPEEDGTHASFAGAFETKLGVSPDALEEAVRTCFSSMFDERVFRYALFHSDGEDGQSKDLRSGEQLAFAVVVMEMVDSCVAGVAFSANPLNSDRDELVIDSSWGLGESVVDGSVEADRFIYCKVNKTILERNIGKKTLEKRLNVTNGGVDTTTIDDEAKQSQSSLDEDQILELSNLVTIVEEQYGTPMDIEFAIQQGGNSLKLLQARPITTLFYIDEDMMTNAGEKRILYYDFNIASEATTTTPFTHMDMQLYTRMSSLMMGVNFNMFPRDPRMPMFCASTRQYANLSLFFRYISPKFCAENADLLDPYLAGLFRSSDCDRKRYRLEKRPKEVNLRNAWWIARKVPMWKLYKIGRKFKSNPEKAKVEYIQLSEESVANLKALQKRGFDRTKGLQAFADELFDTMLPVFFEELGCILAVVLPVFNKLDKKRRKGKTADIRSEYDAFCCGYEGDELMAMNVAMHRLALKLPASIWDEYSHDDLHRLATRIRDNIAGVKSDLPVDFIAEWNNFMYHFGFDGEDQLFISSPRYADTPVFLLRKLRQNVGPNVTDPTFTQNELSDKRRAIMCLHEERAKKNRLFRPFARRRIKKRNEYLEHLLWIRNAPKIKFAQMIGVLRAEILQIEKEMLKKGRLASKGDVFYLELCEVDRILKDDSVNAMELILPRKVVHERALRATTCPLLVDSRCRILKPDPPVLDGNQDSDLLIGAAISPGCAEGKLRINKSPNEHFETGEILCTFVTSPSWTPLFVGASAVILQIGGLLQHGALCCREFQKPGVSNIDIGQLETGMFVRVDGDRGIVQIIDDNKSDKS